MADFVDQVVFNSSDLCAVCYSFLYIRLVNEEKDLFGLKGSSFENLATAMIQGMRDRDIRLLRSF